MAYSTLQTCAPYVLYILRCTDTCQMNKLLKAICSSAGLSEMPLIFVYHYSNPFMYEPLIIVINLMIQQLVWFPFQRSLKTSLSSPLELVCVCDSVGRGGGEEKVWLVHKKLSFQGNCNCHSSLRHVTSSLSACRTKTKLPNPWFRSS